MTERHDLHYTLRPANAADQAAITALIRAVRINPLGLRWEQFVVAVDDKGCLIGCGQIKPHGDGSVELASIAVDRAWRRQRVATAIIEQLMRSQPGPLWLTCMARMVPFYEPFGFVEVTNKAEMPRYFRLAQRAARLLALFSRKPNQLAVMARLVNTETTTP